MASAEPIKVAPQAAPAPSPPAWNDVIARNPELMRAQILSVQSTLHLATTPAVLSGRSKEMKTLHDFIDSRLTKCQGGSLYLCGSPGTGKTASVDHVMRHFVANTTSQLLNSFSNSSLPSLAASSLDVSAKQPDSKPTRKRGRGAATASAASSHETESKSERAPFEYIYINAMSLADPKGLYTELFDRLSRSAAYGDACDAARDACEDDGDFKMSPLVAADMLQSVFCSKSKKQRMCVLVIDEIDSLLTRNQSVLYRIFELPLKAPSSLALIGIANSMDLTEQFLPRLRQRGCEPQLVVVPPYDQHQLFAIVRSRLHQASEAATQAVQAVLAPASKSPGRGRGSAQNKRRKSNAPSSSVSQALGDDEAPPSEPCEVNALDLFEADALELCCRKVASASGDVRKVLDVCRQSLDRLLPCPDVPPSHQVSSLMMGQVLSSVFGSPAVARIQQLPTHQQIVLCIASLLFRQNSKDVTLATFFATYSRLAQLIVLPSVSAGDFVDLFTALDSLGFLKVVATGKTGIKGGKARSKDASDWHKQRIAMSVQTSDIEFALSDNSFFVELLTRAECDGRVQQLLRN